MTSQSPGLKKTLDEHINLLRVIKGLIIAFLYNASMFFGVRIVSDIY